MSGKEESKLYKVILTGEGIKAEREIPEILASHILSLIMGGNVPQPLIPYTAIHNQASNLSDAAISPREFLNEFDAKANWEKILIFGLFLMEHKKQEHFSREDIRGLFKKAQEQQPANYSRDFKHAILKSWLAEDNSQKDSYYVTRKGREYSEQLKGKRA